MLTPSLAKPECAPQEESCVGSAAPWRLHRLKGGGLLLGSPRCVAGKMGRKCWDADTWGKLDIFPALVQFSGDDIQSLSPRKWNTFPWQPRGCIITQLQNVDSSKKASSDNTPQGVVFFSPLINLLCYLIWNSEERHMFNWRCLVEINLWKKKKSWMFY